MTKPEVRASKENAADLAAPREAPHRVDAEHAEIAAFRRRLGLMHLIDVHTHFMSERMLAATLRG